MVNLDKYSSIFIANWKLNGNSSFLKDYYEKLKVNSNNCTIICSPSIYLKSLKGNNENLFCGAQDVSSYKEGAYTGELSASMLKDNNIDFCLVGEPTNPNKLGEMIKIGRRGSMNGRLSVIGIQGHVAYPHRANNPSTALVQILKELKEIKFDKGTKNFQPTNLEVTKINIDNTADNVIPGLANATFNIRFNNKHSSNSIKTKINKILKKICNKNKSNYKIEYSVSGEAFLTKPNQTTYMIQDVIKKITKIKPELSTTGGTSDARFIRKIAPCLEFGLVGKTMHKVDEAVSLNDLKKLTLIYSNILKNYFK